LNLDEQTSEEGFATRVETFADVVRMRKGSKGVNP
jgi:predicted nucleotide-binding protein (sugar kinase/HSP70/actin superfamily)